MRRVLVGCLAIAGSAITLTAATFLQIETQPHLALESDPARRPLVLDRNGRPLRYSFADKWNYNQQISLSEIPQAMISAVIKAEDKNFFNHSGVDWLARLNAAELNIRRGKAVRGASTITEQVVRMRRPRPRTLWSKWLEGWEALQLEKRNSKNEILQFYLNQVPFAGQRRGLIQGSEGVFDRDLRTLTEPEMHLLAGLIKNPSRRGLVMKNPSPPVDASHFIQYVETFSPGPEIRTTLDSGLQNSAQKLLDQALHSTTQHDLNNGAVILVDHQTDEILVWAVGRGQDGKAVAYNSPLIPRQPGSALKPFLYALAFENGYAPSTLVEDSPLKAAVGTGLHTYRNYSRVFYGWLPLSEALANSLNIPAIRLIDQLGVEDFLHKLRSLGITTLQSSSEHYGDGLALGNGEIPLLELTAAYAALARRGVYRPLRAVSAKPETGQRVFTQIAADHINDILSDANARRHEFGRGGNMEFPLQTAVKTGTSTDFRDAWAFAYNYKYVAAVWMGNMDNTPTEGLTGSTVPMLIARSLMSEALQGKMTMGFPSPEPLLGRGRVMDDFQEFRIVQPSTNTRIAIDPRLPSDVQVFTFQVEGFDPKTPVLWSLNGKKLGEVRGGQLQWRLQTGRHNLEARQGGDRSHRTFFVR